MNTGNGESDIIQTQSAGESKEVFFKNVTFHTGSFRAAYSVGCYCDKALMTGYSDRCEQLK